MIIVTDVLWRCKVPEDRFARPGAYKVWHPSGLPLSAATCLGDTPTPRGYVATLLEWLFERVIQLRPDGGGCGPRRSRVCQRSSRRLLVHDGDHREAFGLRKSGCSRRRQYTNTQDHAHNSTAHLVIRSRTGHLLGSRPEG